MTNLDRLLKQVVRTKGKIEFLNKTQDKAFIKSKRELPLSTPLINTGQSSNQRWTKFSIFENVIKFEIISKQFMKDASYYIQHK